MTRNAETWARYGACRETDPETFFEADDFVDGVTDNSSRKRQNAERRLRAKLVCSSCLVRTQCLQDALDADDRFSVRGGLTPAERDQLTQGVAPRPAYVKPKGYYGTPTGDPEIVQRFARGASVASLCEEYEVSRNTLSQRLRAEVAGGNWTMDPPEDMSVVA